MPEINLKMLPRHVAIVMDGNGRWATLRNRPRIEGHRQGSHAVRATVRACRKLGIQALTLFAFSAQNWQRPSGEIKGLMALLQEFLRSEREEMLERQICFRAIGRMSRLPNAARTLLQAVSDETAKGQGMVLTLALSYGGREEIVDAAIELARRVKAGEAQPEDIDEASFSELLPSMDVGPVDLLIRTGAEQRISNFVLWAGAYAELYFSEKMWPDFGEEDVFEAIRVYQQRQRRFGRVSDGAARAAEESSRPSRLKQRLTDIVLRPFN